MVKKTFSKALTALIIGLFLTGCTKEEVLETVPKDIQWSEEQETIQTEVAAEGETDSVEEEIPGVSFRDFSAFEYARQYLNEGEQIWYDQMRDCLCSMETDYELSRDCIALGFDENTINTLFQCVMNDHPELFYVEGYSYKKYTQGDECVGIYFSGTYSVDFDTAQSRQQQVEERISKILDGIPKTSDEYNKVKYIYETLILNTDYDLAAEENQTIYSVFVKGRSVCMGYAKSAQCLLNRLGISCILVQGTVEQGEGHAWNIVWIDGQGYHLDCTWGDAQYRLNEGDTISGNMPQVNYDYLNITTQKVQKTHQIQNIVPVTECVCRDANYFIRENASFETPDLERLKALYQVNCERGRKDFSICCESEECYRQMVENLIEKKEIFQVITDTDGQIAYAFNEKQLSLTFWVTND